MFEYNIVQMLLDFVRNNDALSDFEARVYPISLPLEVLDTSGKKRQFDNSIDLPAVSVFLASARTTDSRASIAGTYDVFIWGNTYSQMNKYANLLMNELDNLKGELGGVPCSYIGNNRGTADVVDTPTGRYARHFELYVNIIKRN